MSAIFAASKEAFLDLLYRRVAKLERIPIATAARRGAYVVMRFPNEQNVGIPSAVLVLSGDLREFFAFTSTYAAHLTPLTAYTNVYSSEEEFSKSTSILERDVPLHHVALVLVERVMTRTPRDPVFRQPDAAAQCAATLSYVASIARLNSFATASLTELEARWASVHERYSTPNVRTFSSAILGFWNLMELMDYHDATTVTGSISDVLEAARSFSASGNLSRAHWDVLTRSLPEIRDTPDRLRGSKELQVEPLHRAINVLAEAQHVDRMMREFLAGYLFAVFANSSFDYLPTAISTLRALPLSVFWFALLASRRSDTDLLDFSGGFGRFLRAKISWEGVSPPRADIAYHELRVTEAFQANSALRHSGASEILVGLFDRIVTRAPIGKMSPGKATLRETDQEVVIGDLARISKDLHGLEKSARAVISKLDAVLPSFSPLPGDQLALLENSDKAKGRPTKRKQPQRKR